VFADKLMRLDEGGAVALEGTAREEARPDVCLVLRLVSQAILRERGLPLFDARVAEQALALAALDWLLEDFMTDPTLVVLCQL
jgi:hypothetical protein